jgi:hypothetical protein
MPFCKERNLQLDGVLTDDGLGVWYLVLMQVLSFHVAFWDASDTE